MTQAFENLTAFYGDIEVHLWRSATGDYGVMAEDNGEATVIHAEHYSDQGDALQAYVAECLTLAAR